MILDQLQNPNLTTQDQEWNFITDQVMGGVSSGFFLVEKFDNLKCYRMKGNVSTKNNGGFIQIRAKLKPNIDTNDYKGIYIKVYGNEKDYSIHLRTGLTFAPWQYYSYKFYSPKNWIEIRAPFTKFKKSNFYRLNYSCCCGCRSPSSSGSALLLLGHSHLVSAVEKLDPHLDLDLDLHLALRSST